MRTYCSFSSRNVRLLVLTAGVMVWALSAGAKDEEEGEDMEAPLKMIWRGTDLTATNEWLIVNDGVMGGLSKSSMAAGGDSTGVFAGQVSLENNGGFASTRTGVQDSDLSAYTGIRIRVLGDGKTYSFRIRTDPNFDGVVYQQLFETQSDQWEEIDLPFSQFDPTFRDREVSDAGALDPGSVKQLGFLISNKQSGPFRLEIDWIAAYR